MSNYLQRSSIVWLLGGFLLFKNHAQTEFINKGALRNIRQITFSSMGFEKAGESYFSPNSKTLLF